jgi:hypothetical protein
MPRLVLGPLLRHVGPDDATVWVETDAACTVEILGRRERTWEVAGHHFAVVSIDGLEPATSTPYDVRLDGTVVWPLPGATQPQSRIRTLDEGRPVRLVFGSCRYATPSAVGDDKHFDADALDAYARRMARLPEDRWPDALLLLGDQVYADETSEHTKERIRARRDISAPPYDQVKDFEEYTWLYHESWADPEVRWLLSTLPSSMIFDDHDIRDDWNTSHAWRQEMKETSWWEERIVGGLSSYWVYQHLGNLSPAGLAKDELYQRVCAHDGDVEPLLRQFALDADAEADGGKGARWSYRRDLCGVRLLVIDSRCGRILADGKRTMVSEAEFRWIEEQVEGTYDHLLVGTSLPWLLARALHDVESWNEAMAAGSRGPLMARWAEKVRRAADLEHWAAFRSSFERLARLFARVGRGEHAESGGSAPATICVLSGDVHHAYAAKVDYGDDVESKVYQLTCSPVHNYVPAAMRLTFRLAWSRVAERVMRFLLRLVSRVPPAEIDWSRMCGPMFGDQIATLSLDGRSATVLFEQAGTGPHGRPELSPAATLSLS